jgi:hypothetical protein
MVNPEIRQPKGNKEAGFSLIKTGYSRFQAHKPVIAENVIKSAPIRPVTGTRSKSEYA